MAWAGALKACFNGCWQGVDQQKPKPEDLLEKIQSDMFSLRLIGGRWAGEGWEGSADEGIGGGGVNECDCSEHTPPHPFLCTPPRFPLSFWAIVWKCPLNDAKEQTLLPSHFPPPPPPHELWVLFQGGGMWRAREQGYTTLIGSDLPLLIIDTRTLIDLHREQCPYHDTAQELKVVLTCLWTSNLLSPRTHTNTHKHTHWIRLTLEPNHNPFLGWLSLGHFNLAHPLHLNLTRQKHFFTGNLYHMLMFCKLVLFTSESTLLTFVGTERQKMEPS